MNSSEVKMIINDHRKIFAIQEEFSTLFPYLKLEFFAKAKTVDGSHASKLVKHDKTLGECRTLHKKGKLTIVPGMTVAELEEIFSSIYGLAIQVWRKSGKVWLETTVTDSWTLYEQNRQGESLSKMQIKS